MAVSRNRLIALMPACKIEKTNKQCQGAYDHGMDMYAVDNQYTLSPPYFKQLEVRGP